MFIFYLGFVCFVLFVLFVLFCLFCLFCFVLFATISYEILQYIQRMLLEPTTSVVLQLQRSTSDYAYKYNYEYKYKYSFISRIILPQYHINFILFYLFYFDYKRK